QPPAAKPLGPIGREHSLPDESLEDSTRVAGQALGKNPGIRDQDPLEERRMVDEAHTLMAEAIGEHVAKFSGALLQEGERVFPVFGKTAAPAAAVRSWRRSHRRLAGPAAPQRGGASQEALPEHET